MKTFILAASISAVNAYTASLADCQTFAAQYAATCGGTAEGDALPDYDSSASPITDWGLGSSLNCEISDPRDTDDPSTVRCPSTGIEASNC